MKSCFPVIHKLEQEYGSIVMGMLRKPRIKISQHSPLVNRMRSEHWSLWSLMDGLEELPCAISRHLASQTSVEIQLSTACTGLEFHDRKVKVQTVSEGEIKTLEADHVISALPSFALCHMICGEHPKLSSLLNVIHFVSVAVVSLQYKTNVINIQGFGHLIPSHESPGVLGVLYESCVFPQHDGSEYSTRLTVMLGGAWFEAVFGDVENCDLDRLTQLAVQAVTSQLGVTERPVRIVSNILKECIPQYGLGHSGVVKDIFDYTSAHRLPLTLIGSSYKGVSVNDCIYNTRLAVTERLLNKR